MLRGVFGLLLLLESGRAAGSAFGRKEGKIFALHDAGPTAKRRSIIFHSGAHQPIVFPIARLKREEGCAGAKGVAMAECAIAGADAVAGAPSSAARVPGCAPTRRFTTQEELADLVALEASSPLYDSDGSFLCGLKCRAREPHLEAKLGPFWDAKLGDAAFDALCGEGQRRMYTAQTVGIAVVNGQLYFHGCHAESHLQLGDLAELMTIVAMVLKLVKLL